MESIKGQHMPASRDPTMLPVKRLEETHQAFMDRCMSDPNMQTAYPEPAQRAALCLNQAGMRPKVGGEAQSPSLRDANATAPLPERRPDETPGMFQSRCMSDPTMREQYPDMKERAAMCYRRSGEEPKVGGAAAMDIRLSGTVTIFQDS